MSSEIHLTDEMIENGYWIRTINDGKMHFVSPEWIQGLKRDIERKVFLEMWNQTDWVYILTMFGIIVGAGAILAIICWLLG